MIILLLIVLWLMWLFNPSYDSFIILLDLTFGVIGFCMALFTEPGKTWHRHVIGFIILALSVWWGWWIHMQGLMFDGPRQPRW